MPQDKAVHVILDNYATHKQPKVRAWLDRHPRWTFHFVPTSCSWINAVEGFFAKLTRRRLKNGVFHSVVDRQAAINRFITEHNQERRPFTWKADPGQIIAAVRREAPNVGVSPLDGQHNYRLKRLFTSRTIVVSHKGDFISPAAHRPCGTANIFAVRCNPFIVPSGPF